MRFLLLNILLLFVFVSCEKGNTPEDQTDTPDFYLNGYKNGDPIKIVAGDDNYYMFTSSSRNIEDVNYYNGRLAKADCDNCGEEFVFRFRGDKQEEAKVLAKAEVDFTVEEPEVKYGVQFNSDRTFIARSSDANFKWEMGDGRESTDKNPFHLFSSSEEFYDVSLVVEADAGQSELKNRIFTTTGCKTWFELVKKGNQYRLVPVHEGGLPKQYFWQFEDGSSASVAELDYDFDAVKGSEKICLTVTDENGCVSQSCQNLIVDDNYAYTAANFEYEIAEIQPKNGFDQFNTLSIEYTDANGVTYYSLETEENASVRITGIENYTDLNEMGLPVKRFQFVMNCNLYSLDGKKVEFTEMTGYFGVAYKQ